MANQIGRRDFLKLGFAGLATAAVGIGASRFNLPVAATPPKKTTAADGKHQWAMVIDESKCVGCDGCLRACHAYNDTPPEIAWSRVENAGVKEDGTPAYRPVPCMHCQDAPCVEICPVGASYRRDDGIIMMDYERCIGCRYCQLACPYGARSFNWETFEEPNPAVPTYGQPEVPRRPRGVVEKCSFCYHRIDRGLAFGMIPGVDPAATPACVVACSYGARIFGDLNDPESPVSVALRDNPEAYRLREELGTEPRVYYIPAKPGEEEPS
ncbi:MAG: 4Fe-4S dicluster domain-containing protein [Chloroflexota bacterium]|jgi:Fe-S-cluster-containing dehydrogenase component